MDRDTAVQRINDGLGFRRQGNLLEPTIILRLEEAQRDLENGKTLPRFLLEEDQTLNLVAGEHAIDLPERFLRLDEDNLPHFTSTDTFRPEYLEFVPSYSDAVMRVITVQRPGEPAPTMTVPRVFTIRRTTIDFITMADVDYELAWNYYKGAGILTTGMATNAWLTYAPDWLIAEAGHRIAKDARDAGAIQLFDDMRQRARAAIFGETILHDEQGGPYVMGSKR